MAGKLITTKINDHNLFSILIHEIAIEPEIISTGTEFFSEEKEKFNGHQFFITRNYLFWKRQYSYCNNLRVLFSSLCLG